MIETILSDNELSKAKKRMMNLRKYAPCATWVLVDFTQVLLRTNRLCSNISPSDFVLVCQSTILKLRLGKCGSIDNDLGEFAQYLYKNIKKLASIIFYTSPRFVDEVVLFFDGKENFLKRFPNRKIKRFSFSPKTVTFVSSKSLGSLDFYVTGDNKDFKIIRE